MNQKEKASEKRLLLQLKTKQSESHKEFKLRMAITDMNYEQHSHYKYEGLFIILSGRSKTLIENKRII